MKPIVFIGAGRTTSFSSSPRGWLAVGTAIHQEGVDGVLICPECRTMEELRAQAEYLKKKIDEAVIEAEAYLPSINS
jgi:hypothetical protein